MQERAQEHTQELATGTNLCYDRSRKKEGNEMTNYRPPYEITEKCLNLISSVSEKLGRLDVTNCSTKPRLRKITRIQSVYSSLKIEANSLPIDTITAILNGREVIGPAEEIREAENAFRAYDRIAGFDPFRLQDLLQMHAVLMDGLCSDAGTFRKGREGVFSGDTCIYMAPEPDAVPGLMRDLLEWMNMARGSVHPAVIACAAHYELVFIHPFSDGNGRLARLWQMAILSSWKPLFRYVPIENSIQQHQQDYYDVIDRCNHAETITEFIEFILEMTDDALAGLLELSGKQDAVTACVQCLLDVMGYETEYSSTELMRLLHLKSRDTLRNHYLHPAINAGLIRMKHPDTPSSRNQRYIRI